MELTKSLIEAAVKAQIPLIHITTRDTINFISVIEHLTGRTPKPLIVGKDKGMIIELKQVYFYVCTKETMFNSGRQSYRLFVEKHASLIIVNSPVVFPEYYNAGELPTPRDMLINVLTSSYADKAKAVALAPALGGCTLKEAAEFVRLSAAMYGCVTPDSVTKTRKLAFVGQHGLNPVDTGQPFYDPPPYLKEWSDKEKPFFLSMKTDPRLVPRGLLFSGPPGCGKTAGAKWLAHQWGVPLYRLDIGATKAKYVGESEAHLMQNLGRIDGEEPAVLLFDEIEKIFTQGDGDHDTTTSMLSQLLWWLAEHKTRVLAIMTTNNMAKLPPELHREGRIDKEMVFEGLAVESAAAKNFVGKLAATFDVAVTTKIAGQIIEKAIMHANGDSSIQVSQAALTTSVFNYVKEEKNSKALAKA